MKTTIGILGAGQLGLMLSESLIAKNCDVIFYDPNPHSPAFKNGIKNYCGSWNDFEKLKDFFESCDLVSYEFENIETQLLNSLIKETETKVLPEVKILHIIQDRYLEKSFIKACGLPIVNFKQYDNAKILKDGLSLWNYPYVIKTSFGGYDGKGQWRVTNDSEKSLALREIDLNKGRFIVEEYVDLIKEVSVVVGRNAEGEKVHFPVFENHHKNHVLDLTLFPARLDPLVNLELIEMSRSLADKFQVVGLLTTEFFIACGVDGKEKIYINECAPRPHNSGHVTRKACNVSQFDVLADILLHRPLPKIISDDSSIYSMGNIMGEDFLDTEELPDQLINLQSEISELFLYGKDKNSKGRKMGHYIKKNKSYSDALNFHQKVLAR